MPDVGGAAPSGRGRNGRALLVEDHPINQRVATAMLGHLGYDVDVVADGFEAVTAAARTDYRVILMDCQIPGLNGCEATQEIRRVEGTARHTPVVAVTGSATVTDRQRCLAAGMDDYLTKPLSLKTLTAALAQWAPEHLVPAFPAQHARGDDVPAPPVEPVPPALDASVIGRLERLGASAGQDLVGQLAAMFLAGADVHIEALRKALAPYDDAALRRSAHPLAGASANLGATGLARLCAGLSTEPPEGAALRGAAVDLIDAELGRVRAALAPMARTP